MATHETSMSLRRRDGWFSKFNQLILLVLIIRLSGMDLLLLHAVLPSSVWFPSPFLLNSLTLVLLAVGLWRTWSKSGTTSALLADVAWGDVLSHAGLPLYVAQLDPQGQVLQASPGFWALWRSPIGTPDVLQQLSDDEWQQCQRRLQQLLNQGESSSMLLSSVPGLEQSPTELASFEGQLAARGMLWQLQFYLLETPSSPQCWVMLQPLYGHESLSSMPASRLGLPTGASATHHPSLAFSANDTLLTQLLLQHGHDAVVGLNAQGDICFINQAALRDLGYRDTTALLGVPFSTLVAKQKDALNFWQQLQTQLAGGRVKAQQGESAWLATLDGQALNCRYQLLPLARPSALNASHQPHEPNVPYGEQGDSPTAATSSANSAATNSSASSVASDSTTQPAVLLVCWHNLQRERQQLSQQHAQAFLLQRMADHAPLAELLTELARFSEQQITGIYCSILLADRNQQCLRHGAAPSLPPDFNQAVDGAPIRYGIGSCGTAAAIGKAVYVADIQTDLLWQDHKHLVAPYPQLKACWSTPFFDSQKQLLGTFAIYANSMREPNAAELDLIQFSVSVAAFLVERSEALTRLDLLSKAIEQTPMGVVICDAHGQVTYANQRFYQLSALSHSAILQQPLSALYPADVQSAMQETLRYVQQSQKTATGEYLIQRPDGQSYWQKYSLRCILDNRQHISHILLEIEDISVQKQVEEQWIESDLRFRVLLENAPGIAIQGYEADGTTFYWNKTSETMYGYRQEEAVGANLLDLIIPATLRDEVAATIARMAATGQAIGSGELQLQHKDGHLVPVFSGHAVVQLPGKPVQIFCLDVDLTAQKQQEAGLRLAAAVFSSSREGILITDTSKRIISANPAITQLFGYDEHELIGQLPSIFDSGRHGTEFYQAVWAQLATEHHWQGEMYNKRKDGEVIPVQLSINAVFDEHRQVTHYAAVVTDLGPLRATEAEMMFLAEHDELTALPNRHFFQQQMDQAIRLAKREQKGFALLVLDVDHFRKMNESHGHQFGDQLLRAISQRLKQAVRECDILSRLGGDEFALLAVGVQNTDDAGVIADKLLRAFNEPLQVADFDEVMLKFSIGIALYPQHASNSTALLQGADAALYKAKLQGRNTFEFYHDDLTTSARDRLALEARLRKAILYNHLQVYFQPQIDMATGLIIGAEALVRWFDPNQGAISPGRFIPVAEASGLIHDIGAFVLTQCCIQGKLWLEAGLPPVRLAVNVSPIQFKRFDMAKLIQDTLHKTGFPADLLELELTESALMENEESVVSMLTELRQLGVRLAIDDFGTGYSSLAYLKRFPLDVLKIDKNFVDDIASNPDDQAIAISIIALGHNLGFKVLAEGVETAEQRDFLQAKGCDHYQGYLFSPPVAADKFVGLLKQQQAAVTPSGSAATTS